jgi:hypothetical protein
MWGPHSLPAHFVAVHVAHADTWTTTVDPNHKNKHQSWE